MKNLPEFYQHKCTRRCHFTRYKYRKSQSTWTASERQLAWNLRNFQAAFFFWKGFKFGANHSHSAFVEKLKEIRALEGEIAAGGAPDAGGVDAVQIIVRRLSEALEIHAEHMLLPLTEVVSERSGRLPRPASLTCLLCPQISQIGGLLGLYLGLSFTFVMEIVDLAATFVLSKCSQRDKSCDSRPQLQHLSAA